MQTRVQLQVQKPIPKLRFSGFFGEWEKKRLGELGEIVGGGTPDTSKLENWNEGINWFTPSEIKKKYAVGSLRKISKLGLRNSSARLLPVGTLLLTSRATIGELSIAKMECSTNQGFQSVIVNDQNINEFLYYWILQNKKEFLRKANGSTFLEISNKEVRKLNIFSTSLPEQQKIASFLSSVDDWIENLRQQKSSLEAYKKGIMQNIFSQEIRFKDENGQDFPEWEEKMLGDILAIVIDNRGKTPPIEKTGIPLLEVNSLGEKSIDYSSINKYVSEETYKNWFRKHLQPNDILFSTVGATALCSLYIGEEKATVAQNIVGLRFKNENPNFMFYLLTEKRNNHKFKRIEMGAVQPSVKVSQMVKIKFLLPSLPEQQKIADFLSSIDNFIKAKEQQISKAEQWKKGLMQQLFV
jgi:type I restriction enzyme, S subunit